LPCTSLRCRSALQSLIFWESFLHWRLFLKDVILVQVMGPFSVRGQRRFVPCIRPEDHITSILSAAVTFLIRGSFSPVLHRPGDSLRPLFLQYLRYTSYAWLSFTERLFLKQSRSLEDPLRNILPIQTIANAMLPCLLLADSPLSKLFHPLIYLHKQSSAPPSPDNMAH